MAKWQLHLDFSSDVIEGDDPYQILMGAAVEELRAMGRIECKGDITLFIRRHEDIIAVDVENLNGVSCLGSIEPFHE